ncbi:MAG: ABC transporter permease, partial [Methylophagaceae bacterium]
MTYSVLYIRKHAHLKAPWKLVIKRKRGVISIMVLMCYVFVGLLDSVHFRLTIDDQQKSKQ